jgi:hypothetical protein
MRSVPPLPFLDYQRIYQFIFDALESSGSTITYRSCVFFAATGATILREHYNVPATISVGSMALRVDELQPNVVIYGRNENGCLQSDENAFHSWVECDGWLIDFMAPILDIALQKAGTNWTVPSRMLQKNLADSKTSLGEIQHAGDFVVGHNTELANLVLDSQSARFFQLMEICVGNYRKLSEPLKMTASTYTYGLSRAPSIEGNW